MTQIEGKIYCVLRQIGRIKIVKMTTLPKVIYRFRAIPVTILTGYFVVIEMTILKFVWKLK